jgi:hypothetical protein
MLTGLLGLRMVSVAPPGDLRWRSLELNLQWIATVRGRLQSLSWFMKCLKEPLSRLANRQDKTRGTFFECRFKSVAILDEEALPAISVYIDLNPVAAKIAETPETSDYTSIQQRLEHVEARRGSIAGPFLCVHPSQAAGDWRTPRCSAPGQPYGLSTSMTRT